MRRSISFGSFCLDLDTRQLLHGPQRSVIHLSPKAFGLLCLLVEARPRAVERRDIHERLWPSTYVSDATLASVVAELRAALGERARTPGFIRTLNGFGFRFEDGSPTTETAPEADTSVWIIVAGQQMRLADGTHVFGRGADVDVRLPSPTVSHRHAKLVITGEVAMLEDLRSKNGTHLRGRRIAEPVRLIDGDRIRMGVQEIVFRSTCDGPTESVG
jgi:DNA-binding winged helix-turn-helix (wHTH) protein